MKNGRKHGSRIVFWTLGVLGLSVVSFMVGRLSVPDQLPRAHRSIQLVERDSISQTPLPQIDRPGQSAQFPRQAAEEPLPQVGAPLASVYSILSSRAASGDTQAAMRLFTDLDKCFSRRVKMKMLNSYGFPSTDSVVKANGQTPTSDELPPQARKILDELDTTDTLCQGVTDQQINDRGDALRTAALNGDTQAMVCYATSVTAFGPPYLSTDWFRYVDRWKTEVIPLVQKAFYAGQADVIPLLIAALAPSVPDTINSYEFGDGLIVPDQQMAYALALLYERLVPQSDLEAARKDVVDLMDGLDADQIRAAQQFADSAWPRFAASAGSQANVKPCSEFERLE